LHALGFPGGQNQAEQPNPRVEAACARDHWAAEREVSHPLPVPSLDRSLAVVRKKAAEAGLVPTSSPENLA
jgi:intracellular multiplication protein IcmP